MTRLNPKVREGLRDLVLERYRDWKGVRAAADEHKLSISQSSLNRFFSGKSESKRTLRTLAILLGTTPGALANQVRLTTPSARGGGQGRRAPLRPLSDPDAFRIAFQLWVEMTTRKLGLPIDPAHDLIAECYDSWYAFFKAARELIKAIPLHKDPRSEELRRLVQLSQAVLNDGLRPHLQRWQARFRRWLATGGDRALTPGLSPQEAQQLFPQWTELCDDLLATNRRLVAYVVALDAMVGQPSRRRPSQQKRK